MSGVMFQRVAFIGIGLMLGNWPALACIAIWSFAPSFGAFSVYPPPPRMLLALGIREDFRQHVRGLHRPHLGARQAGIDTNAQRLERSAEKLEVMAHEPSREDEVIDLVPRPARAPQPIEAGHGIEQPVMKIEGVERIDDGGRPLELLEGR